MWYFWYRKKESPDNFTANYAQNNAQLLAISLGDTDLQGVFLLGVNPPFLQDIFMKYKAIETNIFLQLCLEVVQRIQYFAQMKTIFLNKLLENVFFERKSDTLQSLGDAEGHERSTGLVPLDLRLMVVVL